MVRIAPQRPALLAEAAYELFAEHGFRDVTLDQIATRAEVTKGSLYCHYKSKHDLVLAACQFYYRRYQRMVHAELATCVDPLERLRHVLELSVRTCVIDRQNRVFTTEIFALSLQDDQVRLGWSQFYDSVREMYIGLLAAANASGQLETRNTRVAVDLMLAAMEGVKLRANFEPQLADAAEQQAIVEGLLGILGMPIAHEVAK